MDDFENLCNKLGYKKIIHNKFYIKDSPRNTVKKSTNQITKRNFIKQTTESKNLYEINDESFNVKLPSRPSKDIDIILNDKTKIDKNLIIAFNKNSIKYDDKLDLHGLKIPEAFEIFIKFIKYNYLNNNRILLVITGFGSLLNQNETIRGNLLKWVNGNNYLKQIILYVGNPNKNSGGEGAFLFYLKSNKTN